jgi:hypothetical protein
VGPTVGPLSVSDRSKCYLVLLKLPRKLLILRTLQTCQGSGVGSIPIGRSIQSTACSNFIFNPRLQKSSYCFCLYLSHSNQIQMGNSVYFLFIASGQLFVYFSFQ